jgi:RNase P subunit RPR2
MELAMNTRSKLHSAIPRVTCPRCGTTMRLAEIEPEDIGRGEVTVFDCDCGFEYRMSASVREEERRVRAAEERAYATAD